MKKHIELLSKIKTIGLNLTLPTSLGGNEMELRHFIFELKKTIIAMYSEIEALNERIHVLELESAERNGLVEPD